MNQPPQPNSEPTTENAQADLRLDRIRSGDRQAAASILSDYEPLIRRRYRQKLGRAMRRLVDSQELLSTIARRLDAYVRQGTVTASNERQLWALIFRIGDHALADKARILAHLERVEGPDSRLAEEWRCRFARAERREPFGMELELDAMLRSLEDPVDREILTAWLMGKDFVSIAQETGRTPESIRKRWQRIREQLASTGAEWSNP